MKLAIILTILLLLVACTNGVNTNNNETSTVNLDWAVEDNEEKIISTKGDLIPKVYTDTLYAELNDELQIRAVAQNFGVQRINEEFNYKVILSRDGNVLSKKEGTFKNLFLPTEEHVLYTFNHTFDSYGEYEVLLSVDTENQITELKEDNNNKTITIYVREYVETPSNQVNEDIPAETGLDDKAALDEVAKSGCYDSDGGQEVSTIGTCYDEESFLTGRDDFCSGDDRLAELYCSNKRCNIEIIKCDGACSNGKCI